jgi:iron complex transport system substrate-binding protein
MRRRDVLIQSACFALSLSACSEEKKEEASPAQSAGEPIPFAHARYLKVERRGTLIVAHLSGPVGGDALGGDGGAREQRSVTVVLTPTQGSETPLPPDLKGATVIKTPVTTVATNAHSDEAFLAALGVEERLVAVGGTYSYNDAIREKVKAGTIGQVGYNWHSPPNLDVLLAKNPGVFMMRLSNLAHAPALDRANSLGLTVLPTFAEEEQSYLGRAEWIRFYGLLFGREAQANSIFAEIEANVAALKAKVATVPKVEALWAYPSGGNRWIAVVRGAEATYLTEAGGINLLAKTEDPARSPEETISTEALLQVAGKARVWAIGDLHAVAPRNANIEPSSPAWREGRLFGNTGRINKTDNAYDWYEMGVVRPDWVLSDFVKMLHPQFVEEPFRFMKPLPQGQYQ